MKRKKEFIDPSRIGKSLDSSIRESLKDPEYRKHYMLYRVRAAIATVVKSLRELHSLTQKQLAEKAGVPQSQIARLESLGDERIPSLEQLVKIFSALESRAFLEVVPVHKAHGEKREIVLV